MNITRTGLKKPLKEGDYDGLVEVMGHLMKVKERQVATDSMFEPLKQTIELLKSYGEEMPEEIYLKLQVGPTVLCWSTVAGRCRIDTEETLDSQGCRGQRQNLPGEEGPGGCQGWREPPGGFVGLKPFPRLPSP